MVIVNDILNHSHLVFVIIWNVKYGDPWLLVAFASSGGCGDLGHGEALGELELVLATAAFSLLAAITAAAAYDVMATQRPFST